MNNIILLTLLLIFNNAYSAGPFHLKGNITGIDPANNQVTFKTEKNTFRVVLNKDQYEDLVERFNKNKETKHYISTFTDKVEYKNQSSWKKL